MDDMHDILKLRCKRHRIWQKHMRLLAALWHFLAFVIAAAQKGDRLYGGQNKAYPRMQCIHKGCFRGERRKFNQGNALSREISVHVRPPSQKRISAVLCFLKVLKGGQWESWSRSQLYLCRELYSSICMPNNSFPGLWQSAPHKRRRRDQQ